VDLRGAGRRDHVHRVHLPPQKRQVPCRLVVRRVQRLNSAAKQGQDELFTLWRHHGFATNSTLTTLAADETHRDHALIEQVIAELKDGSLAHAPSVTLEWLGGRP